MLVRWVILILVRGHFTLGIFNFPQHEVLYPKGWMKSLHRLLHVSLPMCFIVSLFYMHLNNAVYAPLPPLLWCYLNLCLYFLYYYYHCYTHSFWKTLFLPMVSTVTYILTYVLNLHLLRFGVTDPTSQWSLSCLKLNMFKTQQTIISAPQSKPMRFHMFPFSVNDTFICLSV